MSGRQMLPDCYGREGLYRSYSARGGEEPEGAKEKKGNKLPAIAVQINGQRLDALA